MAAPERVPYPSRRRTEGLVALVFVQLCFGAFPVLVKIAADARAAGVSERLGTGGFEPRAIAFWRILLGAVALTGLALLGQRRGRGSMQRAPRPGARDLLRLALCALFGVVANQWLALEGMVLTTAVTGGVLMTVIPVFTYALAILVGQERVAGRRVAGIGLALVGALVLVLVQGGRAPSAGAERPVLGALLIVLNCLSYSTYLVLARGLLLRYPPALVVAWTFLFALLALPLLASGTELAPTDPDPASVLALGGLLLFTTVIAYALSAWALARVSASTTAAFVYLQPLIAGTGAMVVLGERPGAGTWIGAAVLLAGLWLVISRRMSV